VLKPSPYHVLSGEKISTLNEFRCVQGSHLAFRLRIPEPVRTVAVHEGLPASVPAEDNELGRQMALDRLAALVERR